LEAENKKPEFEFADSGLLRYVRPALGLVLYFLIYYFVFRDKPLWIIIITCIVLLHETGHFLAMKYFGYRDVQMFFIPLLGGFVSGAPKKVSQRQRVITLFAGPAPGILLGLAALLLFHYTGGRFYYQLGFFMIVLNAFNLLPVTPLDGGQLLENLYGKKIWILQPVFLILAGLFIFGMAVKTGNPWLLIFVWLVVFRVRRILNILSVRKAMDKKGIIYNISYEMLTDHSYMEIRKLLVARINSLRHFDAEKTGDDESPVVKWMQKVLIPPVEKDMSHVQIIISTVIWLILLVIPLVYLIKDFSIRLFLL